MNGKKVFLCLFFILASSTSIVFASNGNVTLPNELTGFINTMTGIVAGLSIIMIVYGGMKYVLAMGDEKAAESAKNQIVSAGIGLFISLCAMIVSKVLLGVGEVESEPVKPNFPGAGIFFFVVFVIGIFSVIAYKVAHQSVASSQGESKEEEKTSVDVNGHIQFVDYLLNNTFLFKEGLSHIHSSNSSFSAKFLRFDSERKSRLSFLSNDKEYLSSIYHSELKEHSHSLSEDMLASENKNEFVKNLLSIHHHLIEQYNHQYFTTQEWVDYLLDSINSRIVREKASSLVRHYETILSYHKQLNDEQLFFLEESFINDLENLLKPYARLSDSRQISMESSLIDRISTLHNKLNEIEESISTQLERDVEYAFRVIDKKYKNNK